MQVVRNFGTLGLRLNLLWFVAALPLLPAIGIPVAMAVQQAAGGFDSPTAPLVLVLALVGATCAACLPAGPATLALVHATACFVQGEEVSAGDFWRTLRRFVPRGWLVLVIDLSLLYVLLFGFYFYLNSGQLLTQVMAFVALYLTLVWIAAQAYLFPLVIRHDVPTLDAFRGAIPHGPWTSRTFRRLRRGRRRGHWRERRLHTPAGARGAGYPGIGGTSHGARPVRDARTLGPGYRVRDAMTRPCLATREARRGARTEAAGGER